jgi:hypothetical protein
MFSCPLSFRDANVTDILPWTWREKILHKEAKKNMNKKPSLPSPQVYYHKLGRSYPIFCPVFPDLWFFISESSYVM